VALDALGLLQQFAEQLTAGDVVGAAALFAPDATYSEPPRFALAGREAISAFFADFAKRHTEVSFQVIRALADPCSSLVAAEWRFAYTRAADGERTVYEGMSWLECSGGAITRWRGFSARVDAGVS
jgi:predicted SnoaL-like aldol condensation-catalyzing enzyme